MGTRAIYFFESGDEICGVYKHYDGYPSAARHHIEDAKEYAWKLPRFEADEFAAGFVAKHKNRAGGEIRLLPLFEQTSIDQVMADHPWCEYYYRIRWCGDCNDLYVTIFFQNDDREWVEQARMPHKQMMEAYPYGQYS